MWELHTQSNDTVATTIFLHNLRSLVVANGEWNYNKPGFSVKRTGMLLTHKAAIPSAVGGCAESLFAGRLEGRMLFFPLLLKTDICVNSPRRDCSHHLHRKKTSAAKKETYDENSPSSPCKVFRGHLLPSCHRIIWRACFGSPASVTYGAR